MFHSYQTSGKSFLNSNVYYHTILITFKSVDLQLRFTKLRVDTNLTMPFVGRYPMEPEEDFSTDVLEGFLKKFKAGELCVK